MFVFNGKKYALNDAEFVDTLFDADGTANGFYKRVRNGVKLYDMRHNLEAFIVANPRQGYFVVSASKHGKRELYMHGLCSLTEKWLGVQDLKMSQERVLIEQAMLTV